MVAFPRINAPQNPPLPVGFPHFPPPSVGRLPWKNGLPTLAPCDPGSPSRHRTIALLAALRCPKNHRAARLLVFSTAASAVIPAAQLPPSAGQIAVPRPSLRDPPPPQPPPRGGASKAPEFLRGPLAYSYSVLVHQRGLRPAVLFLRQHPPPAFGSLISGLATAGSSITFLGGSSSMAGFISRRRSIRIELA